MAKYNWHKHKDKYKSKFKNLPPGWVECNGLSIGAYVLDEFNDLRTEIQNGVQEALTPLHPAQWTDLVEIFRDEE